MISIYIKNGKTIDNQPIEILIEENKIIKTSDKFVDEIKADEVIDLKGNSFVSAGWIDGHTHCYEGGILYGDNPDEIGYSTGVTTVIDAGTTGANTVENFYKESKKFKTNVYALLNISKTGIVEQDELTDIEKIDHSLIKESLEKFPDFLIGIKARMSQSVVGNNGIIPLEIAKIIQKENNDIPLMVHIGSAQPYLKDVLKNLETGDILTHCYNGKDNGILTETGTIKEFVWDAYNRGVYFDTGHGTDSFNFNTAKIAKENELICHSVSSDIYRRNRKNGPVFDFTTTIEKMLSIGYKMSEVLPMITSKPAEMFRLANKGQLVEGYDADITIFNIENSEKELVDSNGNIEYTDIVIKPTHTIVEGKLYNIGD